MGLRRALLILVVLALAPAFARAQAYGALSGWCEAGAQNVLTSGLTSTSQVQASYPSCTVTVYVHGGGLATLYSNSSGAPLANPFTATTTGYWIFYAADGHYDVGLSSVSMPSTTLSDVFLSSVFVNGSNVWTGPNLFTGLTTLNQAYLYSNPTLLAQDPLITASYDGLFTYLQLAKNLTVVPNSIGFANIYQMNGTPGPHGAYGFYVVADFYNLGGGLGVGFDNDTYYQDNSASNSNVLPGTAYSTTTRGSANYTSPIVGAQAVIEHLGSGVLTFATPFMAPNSGNLGAGSIATIVGFAALDQKAVGTGLTAGFWAAPQTACGTCFGFYSSPTNNDLMGNLTITSLLVNGGGPLTNSTGFSTSGSVTANSYILVHTLASSTTPTISSGFGSAPAVQSSNGTATFRIGVGTGGSASAGVIGMPAANAGWDCSVGNLSAHAGNRTDDTVQTASTTSTVTVQNQTKSTGVVVAWSASDVIYLNCVAF